MSIYPDFAFKDILFHEDFNINTCLSQLTQNSDLNSLKISLKHYGEILQRDMGKILKNETEAIVHLAEQLSSLHVKVLSLLNPVSQFREEMKILNDLIQKAVKEYLTNSDDLEAFSKKENILFAELEFVSVLEYIKNLFEDGNMSDIDVLERTVLKYSLKYIPLMLMANNSNDVASGTEKLFLVELNSNFLKYFQENMEHNVMRCLRMYHNLNEQKEAESFFRKNFVRPKLKLILNENNLKTHNNELDALYLEALNILNRDMNMFDNILSKNSDLKNAFNFTFNSFWTEFDRQSREGLPYIAAPGNPELFQKRYTATWSLLEQIALKCGDVKLIINDDSFQEHIRRFNLPVYFEIIFQQIAGEFESGLAIDPGEESIFIMKNEYGVNLSVTANLHKALHQCFSKNIFINQLSNQFLKMSMFITSRYLLWFQQALEKCTNGGSNKWECFLIKSIVDLNKLKQLLGTERCLSQECELYSVFPEKMHEILVKLYSHNYYLISKLIQAFNSRLLGVLVEECLGILQQVSSIPRLFRKTNRNLPKEASTYMVEATKVITNFHTRYMDIMDILDPLIENIILDITAKFKTLVQDVLRSVCKTEESLRRLKNRNYGVNEESNASQSNSSSVVTDEMKIREQIRLDVNYFIQTLEVITPSEIRNTVKELENVIA